MINLAKTNKELLGVFVDVWQFPFIAFFESQFDVRGRFREDFIFSNNSGEPWFDITATVGLQLFAMLFF